MRHLELVFNEELRSIRVHSGAHAAGGSGNARSAGSASGEAPVERIDPRLMAAARAEEDHVVRVALAGSIRAALDTVGAQVTSRLDEARDWIFELAIQLAEQVLDKEIDAGSYDLGAALRGCLDAAFETGQVLRILVHPEDVAHAGAVVGPICSELGVEPAIRVEASHAVERGACRVETAAGQYRHDPRKSLDQAAQTLREAISQ